MQGTGGVARAVDAERRVGRTPGRRARCPLTDSHVSTRKGRTMPRQSNLRSPEITVFCQVLAMVQLAPPSALVARPEVAVCVKYVWPSLATMEGFLEGG